ncbi:hypothetical protein BKA70DRAFT_1306591, partial [Coprinopsis sp. MPI-PUGE-AT-0042]
MPDEGAIADRKSRRSASILVKRFVLVLGSLHLTLMAALGIWLWSDLLSFGHGRRRPLDFAKGNQCAVDSAVVAVIGQAVPMHSEALRIMSFILYSALLIPGFNLVIPTGLFLSLYIAWPSASRVLSWIQVIRQASVERLERRCIAHYVCTIGGRTCFPRPGRTLGHQPGLHCRH